MFHVYHCFRIGGSDSEVSKHHRPQLMVGCLVPVFTTSLSTDCAGTVSAAVTGRLLPADVTTVMSAQVSPGLLSTLQATPQMLPAVLAECWWR